MTVGLSIHRIHGVEPWPYAATTARTRNQAIATKTLSAHTAGCGDGGELPAARTTNRAGLADQMYGAILAGNAVRIEMAAALKDATMGTRLLARQTDFVATGWAATHVMRAGALTTRPTGATAVVAVRLTTNGTCFQTTACADDFLTSRTLCDARITDQMAVAIECHAA